jgi:integrase
MLDYTSPNGKQWSLASIRQALRLLQRSLDAAVAEGYIEDNPAASVKAPQRRAGDETIIDDDEQSTAQAKALTPEHQTLLLAEFKRTEKYHGLTTLYILALRLGLRRGELLGLRWKDIDLEEKVLRVRQHVVRLDNQTLVTTPKTGSSRRDLPLSDDLVSLLHAHKLKLGALGRVKGLVFPNQAGDIRQPNSITQHFRRTCDRLGLKGYTLHSLRKTAITNWRRNGVDLEVAGALAGHKGVKVTAETYSDAQMDRKRAAIEKGRKAE